MHRRPVAWAITGMVRNQGLLLSNIELILSAASPNIISLIFVANDDDPLATDSFLETVELFGARVVRLPRGQNGSWDLLTRQTKQLEYAWIDGGLCELGARVLVRSRTDLWIRRDYVTWICEDFAGQDHLPQKVLVRGVHPTLPGYAEDLILAAPTHSIDLLLGVREDLVPAAWRSHQGLMVHLARFAQAYTSDALMNQYENALSAVESEIRARTWGELRWKAITTTLPGGFWMLHRAALGELQKRGQLLDFLRHIQGICEQHFVLAPDAVWPGHGLDRGNYERLWSPIDMRALLTATSTDFVASEEEIDRWRLTLIDGAKGLQQGLSIASEFAPPTQKMSEAAFLGAERVVRKSVLQVNRRSRARARQLRKYLPAS